MKKYSWISLLLCILLLAGCGREKLLWTADDGLDIAEHVDTLGESDPLGYEVPKSVPKVLINQVGYKSDSLKVAFFIGEGLAETFDVVDAQTRETVYTGKIEKKSYSGETDAYFYYGVFTGCGREGSYYIKTEKIGRSYTFEITPDVYNGLFESVFEDLTRKSSSWSIKNRCYVMTALMSAYELYPAIFEEELGMQEDGKYPAAVAFLKEQAEALAEQQDAKTGGVGEDGTASADLAGVMARFSGMMQKYDKNAAAEYLKSAKKAWDYAVKNRNFVEDDDMYFAAAQLFRGTGEKKYHQEILSYTSAEGHETGSFDISLYGDIAYLSTEKGVDMGVCRELMEQNMRAVEEIAELSQEKPYLVASDRPQENQAELLHMMVKLAVVDYVITNHEYATVMENHLHYFLGRNPQAVSFVPGFGDGFPEGGAKSLLDDPVKSVDFLFMMSAVMNHEMDGKQ